MKTLHVVLGLVVAFGSIHNIAEAVIFLEGRNVDTNTTLFSDNGFESDTVGSAPANATVGSWSVLNPQNLPGVTNALTPGAYAGSNYLHIARPATPAASVRAVLGSSVGGGDTLEFSFAMLHTGQFPGIAFQNGSTDIARIQGDDGGNYRIITDPAGGAGAWENTGLASTLNVWQEITMTWDTDGSLFRLTVDGNSYDYTGTKVAANVDRLSFRTDDGGAVFYLDGAIVPEPTSALTLGIGSVAFGLLLRRRRPRLVV